jgi:hypothetical protein
VRQLSDSGVNIRQHGSNEGVWLTRSDSSKRSAAAVRCRDLETNVFVSFYVVPTRSARVIADEVSHHTSIDTLLIENENVNGICARGAPNVVASPS